MRVPDAKLPDTASLLKFAENAVNSANSQITACSTAIRVLSSSVRAIALDTIEVLLSSSAQADIDRRKSEVVKQYSTVLYTFSQNIDDPIVALNKAWMALDQDLGFYLLSAGRETDTDPEEIRQLINVMINARKEIPETVTLISNIKDVIKASAGGLTGLEEAINESSCMLDRLSGELDLGDAVLQRQILLSSRLYDLMKAS